MKKYRVETHILDGLTKGDEITEGKYLDFIENYCCPESWFSPVEEEVKEGQYWKDTTGSVLRIDNVRNNYADCTFIDDDSTGRKTLDFIKQAGKLLDDDAVGEHLIAEAKRRGYPESKWKSNNPECSGYVPVQSSKDYHSSKGLFEYFPELDKLSCKGHTCYYQGEWADLIDEPIQINGYEAEFKDGYVQFGCAKIFNDIFTELSVLLNHEIPLSVETKHIRKITIGNGEFTTEQIHEIAKRIKDEDK